MPIAERDAEVVAPGGKTSPEELIAAAHASCFAVALSLVLGEVKAAGVDEAGFADAVEQAKALCPVSNALAGDVEIEVEATFEGVEP